MSSEPVEIKALRTNITNITDAVADGDDLQWFASSLVDKAFITQRAAQGILSTTGVSPAYKANQLLNGVFAAVEVTERKRERFGEFVSLFSGNPVYADLVRRLNGPINAQGESGGRYYIIV